MMHDVLLRIIQFYLIFSGSTLIGGFILYFVYARDPDFSSQQDLK